MLDFEFYRANSVHEAINLVQNQDVRVIAGGTDLIPLLNRELVQDPALLDISSLQELAMIQETETEITIGACVTHEMITRSDLLQQHARVLRDASKSIGCSQTRARGTIGGNLVNASPAADTAPALLALDAELVISSIQGPRTLPISSFFVGPGKTVLAKNEILSGVRIRKPTGNFTSIFLKLGKRKGMSIAVASVALFLELDAFDRIKVLRIAFGSLAPTPVRGAAVEKQLIGQLVDEIDLDLVGASCREDISPITDIRASSDYRLKAATVMTRRALVSAIERLRTR
ncbi:MAG: xanthine dehydrogenase family protein subunit M [Chloroflexi bacterium]|nr:xanthine dehydrogenase family protein subunit M [Chloroflexota bacterium]